MAACGVSDEKKEEYRNPIVLFRCIVNADLRFSLRMKGVKSANYSDYVEIKAELYLDRMPVTVSNFIDLCNNEFYDGIHFHRIIDGFMIQFGCPNAKDPDSKDAGKGSPEPNSEFKILYGKRKGETVKRNELGCIEDEMNEEIHKISNEPFTLAMANSGEHCSGGSQFFINTKHNDHLDWFVSTSKSAHPVFGKILSDSNRYTQIIEKVETDDTDRPKAPLKMKDVRVFF